MRKLLFVLLFSYVSFANELDVVEYYSYFNHPSVYMVSGKLYFLDKKNHYYRLTKESKKEPKKVYEYYSKLPVER